MGTLQWRLLADANLNPMDQANMTVLSLLDIPLKGTSPLGFFQQPVTTSNTRYTQIEK